MKDLIKALQFILQFMKDPDDKYPTACGHDTLYIWGIDFSKMSYQDVKKLLDYEFFPGTDDDWDIIVDYLGEDNGWDDLTEETWLALRYNISDCVHSYRYGSC